MKPVEVNRPPPYPQPDSDACATKGVLQKHLEQESQRHRDCRKLEEMKKPLFAPTPSQAADQHDSGGNSGKVRQEIGDAAGMLPGETVLLEQLFDGSGKWGVNKNNTQCDEWNDSAGEIQQKS
jgi:hypothetical protein